MGCTRSVAVAPEPAGRTACGSRVEADLVIGKGATQEHTLHEVLGQGSFGVVCSATRRSTGEAVAVKAVDLAGKRARERDFAQEEVALWRSVGSHPNVVELRTSFTEMQYLFIVMEECQGNLFEWLCDEFDSAQAHMSWVMREMLLGIQACHQAMVVHRDIKPENYLVSAGATPRIKLSDFGLAARLPAKGGLRGACGTPFMMSPEMLRGKRYGAGTDMWSFGVSAYLLLFAELPHAPKNDTREAMKRATAKGKVPRWMREERLPGDQAKQDFLRPLLCHEPRLRASAEQALEHAFLRNASHPSEQPVEKVGKQGNTQAKQDFLRPVLCREPRLRASAEQALEHAFLQNASHPSEQPVEKGGKQGNTQEETQETLAPLDDGEMFVDLDNGGATWSVDARLSR